MKRQRLLQRKPGGAERAEIVEEDGHVEMRAPFARTGVLYSILERVLEVEEPGHLPSFFWHVCDR